MNRWQIVRRAHCFPITFKFAAILFVSAVLQGCQEQERKLLEWAKKESSEAFQQACERDFTSRFYKHFYDGISAIHKRYKILEKKINPLLEKNEKFLKKKTSPSEQELSLLSSAEATAVYKKLYYEYSDQYFRNSDILLSFDADLADLERHLDRFDKTCETFGEDYLIPPADLVGMLGNFSSQGFTISMTVSTSFGSGSSPDGSNSGSFSPGEDFVSQIAHWINGQVQDLFAGRSRASIVREAFTEMKNRLPSLETRKEWAKKICKDIRKKELVDENDDFIVDESIKALKSVLAATRRRVQYNHQVLFYYNAEYYEGLKKRAYAESIREIVAAERIFQLNQEFQNDFELAASLDREIFAEFSKASSSASRRECEVARTHFGNATKKIELLESLLIKHAASAQSSRNVGLDEGWEVLIERYQSRLRTIKAGMERLRGRGLCQF